MTYRTISVLFAMFLPLLGPVTLHAANTATPQTQLVQTSPSLNPMDPSTWMKPGGAQMRLNLAHPATWMMFADPNAHTTIHTSFMNPANYSQFMQPQF